MRLELILPLLLALCLFVLARRLPRQGGTLILALVLLPVALLPASGYLHLWDGSPWFCEVRSRACSDFLPALASDGEVLILAEPLSGERRLRGPAREKYLSGLAGPVMTLRLKKC